MRHTKGPWRLKRSTYFDQHNSIKEYCWIGIGPIGDETPVWSKSLPENESNCRLIAAAPDLLDAAIDLIDHLTNKDQHLSDKALTHQLCKLILAINKAKGE